MTSLGELIALQRGYDLPESQRRSGDVPVIGSAGINGYHDTARAKAPGVTLGRSGASFGKVTFVREDFWPHNAALFVTDFKGNDPLFIRYLLESLDFSSLNSGSAQQSLNRNYVYGIPVRKVDLPVQRRIAGILSAYDDLTENNQRRIKILEEMARSLYREWFVNFRYPGHEKVPLVDSPLGVIPEDWLLPFADHVDFKEGPGLRNWQYRNEGIAFLNIRTLVDNDIDLSKVQFLDAKEVEDKYQHFLLREHDHVVSSSGTIGRIVTIRGEHLPLMLNTSIIRMRPQGKRMGCWQLKHFMLSDYFQNQAKSFATGAAQPNFGPIHLKQMKIIAPNQRIATEYERLVGPVELTILSLARRSHNLRRMRDLLLPRLLSGQLGLTTTKGNES